MFWAGSAARALRVASLPESTFWELTPNEVDGIMLEALEEWRARERGAAYNSALICAVLCNCHRDPKSHPEPFTPDDFLPRIETPKPEPKTSEVAVKAKAAMKALSVLYP